MVRIFAAADNRELQQTALYYVSIYLLAAEKAACSASLSKDPFLYISMEVSKHP